MPDPSIGRTEVWTDIVHQHPGSGYEMVRPTGATSNSGTHGNLANWFNAANGKLGANALDVDNFDAVLEALAELDMQLKDAGMVLNDEEPRL